MLEISVEAPLSPCIPPILSSMDISPLAQKRPAGELLMERARQGMKIMKKCCPVCATPLCIQSVGPPKYNAGPDGETQLLKLAEKDSALYNECLSKSFDDGELDNTLEIEPLPGVPFCVNCPAHVVTESSQIDILAESGEMAMSKLQKGSIVVAIDDEEADKPSSPEKKEPIENTTTETVKSPLDSTPEPENSSKSQDEPTNQIFFPEEDSSPVKMEEKPENDAKQVETSDLSSTPVEKPAEETDYTELDYSVR